MKTRLGSLQLILLNEDGSQKYLHQSSVVNRYTDSNFSFYTRSSEQHSWERIYKPSEYRVQWIADTSRMWGEPISLTLPGGLNIIEANTQPRHRASEPLPVSISGDWTWEDPFIVDESPTLTVTNVDTNAGSVTMSSDRPQGLTSGAAIRMAMEDAMVFGRSEVRVSREALAQQFPSHMDHVRAHQEEINRISQQLAANEMARRAQQSQADQRRREEERNRQRRPWERVRNFFGRD